ncbi:hypothetical protein SERLADRAFT_416941 [Serpula lacrymans var. lacrymans S7.9]|uniref:DUF6533 domain-containing protein n=1 Tax=Serpula lacrymans var. lacrymans (strain S7.9) TaxID=578457 RepID=F8P2V9_SERL9|nr:uncharacterized protein SERLADRAFT_416941 [Serpula lacrymans var. lacrymans S7.9]EGO22491.1 hypothetical protein SERLADRAFT_416941 [Serpula lacrymans var. lacrymans S7.9]
MPMSTAQLLIACPISCLCRVDRSSLLDSNFKFMLFRQRSAFHLPPVQSRSIQLWRTGYISQSIVNRTIGVAGGTLLLWDFLLTFGDEVEYIWSTRWSFAKVTFLTNRYGNLLFQVLVNGQELGIISGSPATQFCFHFTYFISIFMNFSAESIHILVLVRAWAIWGCKPRMATILITIYIIYLLLAIGFTTFGASQQDYAGFFATDIIRTCIGQLPPYLWLLWVARCNGIYFDNAMPEGLFADAIIFFVVSTLNNVLTIMIWNIYSGDPKYFISVTFFLPILSMSGQRLVLNLRRINMRSRALSTDELGREVDRQLLEFHFDEDESRRVAYDMAPERSMHSEMKQDEESCSYWLDVFATRCPYLAFLQSWMMLDVLPWRDSTQLPNKPLELSGRNWLQGR